MLNKIKLNFVYRTDSLFSSHTFSISKKPSPNHEPSTTYHLQRIISQRLLNLINFKEINFKSHAFSAGIKKISNANNFGSTYSKTENNLKIFI
jgi:hypothetical protein